MMGKGSKSSQTDLRGTDTANTSTVGITRTGPGVFVVSEKEGVIRGPDTQT